MSKRNSNGTFAAGSSGNPAGRPKRTEQEKKIRAIKEQDEIRKEEERAEKLAQLKKKKEIALNIKLNPNTTHTVIITT